MNVSLTPELDAFVEQAVRSGRYGSASEAVREGLRLLQEREARFEQLKRDIRAGEESGEGIPVDRALIDEIKSSGRERLRKRHAAE
jgi:antitoxin ParD1/3/4